ncbi:MAG TPA: ester cyclase [Miltoncostaeaceae bacterium]|nr:ester cyclase [Miltoncostaeaceae bacterium]
MGLSEFVDAWNRQQPDDIAAQFTPDGIRHQFSLPEARLAGRDAIAQGVGAIIQAVPDATLEVRSLIEGADGRVVVEWTFSGTHENDFPGMPASGATVVLPGVSVYTLAADGLIALENAYWDTATLLSAAGVLG